MFKKSGLEKNVGENKYLYILILIAIIALPKFMYYLYVPGLPEISQDFHVGKSLATSSLSFAMIGVGISILFYGPLSDSLGRKTVMLSGIVILIVGLVMTIFSHTSFQFLLSRFIQGIGGGSIAVILKLMIKDHFKSEDIGWAASTFAMFVALLPAVAPFLGGIILIAFSWRVIFVLLLVYAIIIFVLIIFRVEETLEKTKRVAFKPVSLLKSYMLLFKYPDYLIVVLSMVLSFSCLGIYLTGSSFLFQTDYGYTSSEFGTIIVIPTLFFALGCFIASKLSKRTKKYYPIIKGSFGILLTGVLLLILHPLNMETALSTIIMISILGFAVGFTYSNCFAGMLRRIPAEVKGAGVAFANAIQLVFSGVIIYLFSLFHFKTTIPFGIVFILLAVLIIILTLFLFKVTPKEE